MAVYKTEAVVPVEKEEVQEGQADSQRDNQLTYLGIEIYKHLSFGPHITKVAQLHLRPPKQYQLGKRLMPNVVKGGAKKRRPLASVFNSQMLYTAPAWKEEANKVVYLKRIALVHCCVQQP